MTAHMEMSDAGNTERGKRMDVARAAAGGIALIYL